jgi:hypothetical protein
VSRSTDRIRPWQERREQTAAVAAAYQVIFERTGDVDIERVGRAGACCGTRLGFEELYAEAIDATKLRLNAANFCRGRLCPLCNWRRSVKLKYQLRSVLAEVFRANSAHRVIMLTLTVPNVDDPEFEELIGKLLKGFERLSKYTRFRAAVEHWFRALEIAPGRKGKKRWHPHIHVLLVVSEEYFDPKSDLYIPHAEWRAMWERAVQSQDRRIVDIRIRNDPGEVAKYVTKPGAYLKINGNGAWWCDPERLETLHDALASRRLVAWSRSLSAIRRKLGFVKDDNVPEDLVDVGEDDDTDAWVPFREVQYRWRRNERGRMAYHLWFVRPVVWGDPEDSNPYDFDNGEYSFNDPDPGGDEDGWLQ